MLEKSSAKPQQRLLNLFDILDDWLDAPAINTHLHSTNINQTKNRLLQDFLSLEAAKAGAEMPEILADQLYFMALAAAQEKLHGNHLHSLSHAKSAAHALIAAQTKKEFRIQKTAAYAIAASFFVLVGAGALLIQNTDSPSSQIARLQPTLQSTVNIEEAPTANPEQTAAIVAQLEQMRHGNCQLIEAIQLPDSQKGIYINMIVNGHVSTDPKEQLIALDLIKKTRCNYTPMLMANSK